MLSLSRHQRFFAACLSGLAGYVDAVGFIATGGYFLSFMSGNSTRMAVGAEMDWWLALPPLGLIASFLLGVIFGTAIGRRAKIRRAPAILVFIALLLTLAAIAYPLGLPLVAFALAAMAMGAENTIYESDGEVRVGLTYMTGTLVKLGQRLHDLLNGDKSHRWFAYFILWAGLATGAVGGALAYSAFGMASLWIAVGAALLLALVAIKGGAEAYFPG